jgi:hypothetical protein
MERNIEQVLNGRKDIAPFFVHLTKSAGTNSASDILKLILNSPRLLRRGSFSGSAHQTLAWGTRIYPSKARAVRSGVPESASIPTCISLTETPLDQIHCLLDIRGRAINLEPYGIVLLKSKIQNLQGVNPVWYVNNYNGSNFIKRVVETMWRASFDPQPQDSLDDVRTRAEYSGDTLREALCFIEMIGQRLGSGLISEPIDFYWEREWRSSNDIELVWGRGADDNVFMGLCPHAEIEAFEGMFPLVFMDPLRNPNYYAEKILNRKLELGINHNLF